MILKRFSPDQSVAEVDFSTTEFWIQVHSLPLDRHSMENLLKIGSIAGRALETNFIGSSGGVWRRYIQVRVEVDVNCPLAPGFPLERDHLPELWIPFKYEKLGNFCFGCGILGHEQRDCQNKGAQSFIQEGMTGFFGRWLRADNDEFQPRRKFGNQVELENEECCRVNESNTEMASSQIQVNLESSNDMVAREEQGSRDRPVDVLEPCVETVEPVQVDGTSFGDATLCLSETLVKLDSHVSSVNYQPDGSTPITCQPVGSTSFTSWNLVCEESLEPNSAQNIAYNPAQNSSICINNPNPHHKKPTTNPMKNDPQTPNQTQSHKDSKRSKRKLNSLSPPNTPTL